MSEEVFRIMKKTRIYTEIIRLGLTLVYTVVLIHLGRGRDYARGRVLPDEDRFSGG
jgi:hypothetical protein